MLVSGCLDPLTKELITFEDNDDLQQKIDTIYSKLDEDGSGGLNFLEFQIGVKEVRVRRVSVRVVQIVRFLRTQLFSSEYLILPPSAKYAEKSKLLNARRCTAAKYTTAATSKYRIILIPIQYRRRLRIPHVWAHMQDREHRQIDR